MLGFKLFEKLAVHTRSQKKFFLKSCLRHRLSGVFIRI